MAGHYDVIGFFLKGCCAPFVFWGVVVFVFLPAFLWVLAGFGLVLDWCTGNCFLLFCVFCLESLILAQDERWRRA